MSGPHILNKLVRELFDLNKKVVPVMRIPILFVRIPAAEYL